MSHIVQGVFDTHYVYHIGTFEECAAYIAQHDLHYTAAAVPL